MQQASADPHGISYGFITLGRAGTDGVKQPGHMLAYFATEKSAIFIDLQALNGVTGVGDVIFHDLKNQFHFANATLKTDSDTFGQFVFFAPLR